MSSPDEKSAWACVLTSQGRGAVAIVRIWGADALAVADAVFRPRQGGTLAETPRGRLRVGQMGAGIGDEVVAVVLEGDPAEVEIHCHGGPAPLDLVAQALQERGVCLKPPEAWLTRGGLSATSAEASLDLARAPTLRAAEILLDQAHGALDTEVRKLLQLVPSESASAIETLGALIERAEVGLRLVSGWRVALAGRPNVGKSRLLNALAGYERAIVDPAPGTTRDVVTVRTSFEGWPVELADTAGLRDTADPTEASGVALARAQQAAADLVVLVLDRSEPLTEPDRALVARHQSALRVANKADLAAAWEPRQPGCLSVSALRGDGIDAVIAAIAQRLVADPPSPGSAVPFRAKQLRLLRHARRWLVHGRIEAALRALTSLANPETNRDA